MDRRTALVTVVGTAATALAGCLGQAPDDAANAGSADPGVSDTGSDGGDETAGATASADLEGRVLESQTTDLLAIRETELFREENDFGVRGVVENDGDRPMTNVEVHVRLVDPDGGLVGEFVDSHADEAEVWRLDPGHVDAFAVRFEDTDPAAVEGAVRYEVWADGTVE